MTVAELIEQLKQMPQDVLVYAEGDLADAEPLDCGNCEIVQASINTGIRTATRLVDDVLDKIRAEIIENAKSTMNDTRAEGLYVALNIVDKYRNEVSK